MVGCGDLEKLPLPRNRPKLAERAVLHATSLMATAFKIKGRRGVKLELNVAHLEGRRHLPIIELRPAA